MFTLPDLESSSFADNLASRGLLDKLAMAKDVGQKIGGGEFGLLWIPGRIEVMGKHTDYCGGKSLLACLNKGFMCAWRPSDRMEVMLGDNEFSWDIESDIEGTGWANYFVIAASRLYKNFKVKPVKMVLVGDLPESSGMSSSSCLICTTFMALRRRNELEKSPLYEEELKGERLYEYLGCIENGQTFCSLIGNKGMGTFGGSEDHTAIMSCRRHVLNMFSYCPTKFLRSITLPETYIFCVGVSGVLAEKTGDRKEDYNDAVRCNQQVLSIAKEDFPDALNLSHLVQSKWQPQIPLSEAQRLRWEQFAKEDALVSQWADGMENGDLASIRQASEESMEWSDKGLRNIIPETRWLPAKALELGAIAASAFGAGFGGSVWALVENGKQDLFLRRWEDAYRSEFPSRTAATFFATQPQDGAQDLGVLRQN